MARNTAPLIAWNIEEYKHREKSTDWYWALGVIALAGAILAVLAHDILFAVLIVLCAIMLGIFAARAPETITIKLTEEGIIVRDYLYAYTSLKGFAIEEHDLGSYLLVESSRAIAPIISIALPHEGLDYATLRDFLLSKVPEKTLKEPVSHRIMEHLGF